ncbi:MAG TPA: hypothetical protein VLE46_08270 [Nitrospira sp.]|nr:hypothetical protein [Nitrospira sp.]
MRRNMPCAVHALKSAVGARMSVAKWSGPRPTDDLYRRLKRKRMRNLVAITLWAAWSVFAPMSGAGAGLQEAGPPTDPSPGPTDPTPRPSGPIPAPQPPVPAPNPPHPPLAPSRGSS